MSSQISLVIRFAVLLAGFSTSATYAAPTATKPAAATSNASYPLKTCVVSGGKLGGMGKPVEYVYQQAGQPDHTVIFCCRACIKKFEKDPTKFLANLDAAETPAKAATKQ
jgi:hypothetical protein